MGSHGGRIELGQRGDEGPAGSHTLGQRRSLLEDWSSYKCGVSPRLELIQYCTDLLWRLRGAATRELELTLLSLGLQLR